MEKQTSILYIMTVKVVTDIYGPIVKICCVMHGIEQGLRLALIVDPGRIVHFGTDTVLKDQYEFYS